MVREVPVSEQVRLVLPSLPRAERRVAISLPGDYPAAALEMVASLAARAGTSGPTVLRLASRLGFSGFTELQQALRDELTDSGRPTAKMRPELAETAGRVPLSE